MPLRLDLRTRAVRDWLVVCLRGEIDLATTPQLVVFLRERLQQDAPRLSLDLSHAGFIDSTGLAALLNAKRFADRQGADFVVVAPPGCAVRRAIDVTRLARLVPVADATPDQGVLAEATTR